MPVGSWVTSTCGGKPVSVPFMTISSRGFEHVTLARRVGRFLFTRRVRGRSDSANLLAPVTTD